MYSNKSWSCVTSQKSEFRNIGQARRYLGYDTEIKLVIRLYSSISVSIFFNYDSQQKQYFFFQGGDASSIHRIEHLSKNIIVYVLFELSKVRFFFQCTTNNNRTKIVHTPQTLFCFVFFFLRTKKVKQSVYVQQHLTSVFFFLFRFQNNTRGMYNIIVRFDFISMRAPAMF